MALLWCLTLLGLLVIEVLFTARTDLKTAKNQGDEIQAYYLALAGVEKAKALIYHEAADRKHSGQNHSGLLYNDPTDFKDVHFGRGEFRVIRQGSADEGGGLIYGIADEDRRLNVNQVGPDQLTKLYGMTQEIAASLADWRDQDNEVSPGGAETDYYAGLRPPYLPRNDRIQTARELLLVKGITPEILFGEDVNANGLLDPGENDGDLSFPPDNRDGVLDAGWSGLLCFESSVRNESAAGQSRVNVQTADENTLTSVPGITPEIAKAIVAYREQNRLESISDLLEVREMRPTPAPPPQQNAPGTPPNAGGENTPGQPPNQPAAQPVGPKLISEDLLTEIGDDVTTATETTQRGLININTASAAVLYCLPGMTEEIARDIVSYRASSGYFRNVAYLLKVPGFTPDLLKRVAPRVTARSETFRIVSEGKVASSGARKRMEVIVQLGTSSSIDTISYRENL